MTPKWHKLNLVTIPARLLEMQLRQLREYMSLVETGFARELKQLEKRSKAVAPEHREEYWDWCYDNLALARDDGPQTLRAAVLVSCYSVLERSLSRLCDIAKRQLDSKADPPKRNRRSLPACREYLYDDLGLEFDDTAEWPRLTHVRLIRNCASRYPGWGHRPGQRPPLLQPQRWGMRSTAKSSLIHRLCR